MCINKYDLFECMILLTLVENIAILNKFCMQ